MRANAPVYFDGEVWAITRHDDLMAASKDSPPIPSMINWMIRITSGGAGW